MAARSLYRSVLYSKPRQQTPRIVSHVGLAGADVPAPFRLASAEADGYDGPHGKRSRSDSDAHCAGDGAAEIEFCQRAFRARKNCRGERGRTVV